MNDNPKLTCRAKKKGVRHPARIILDRRNKIPLKAKVFANSKKQQVIYIAGPKLSLQRKKYLVENPKGFFLKINTKKLPSQSA